MVSLVTTDGLASKLRSLDCEPLCVENLVWSLPAGDNFQRRSATDGFLYNERSSEDGPERSSTRSVSGGCDMSELIPFGKYKGQPVEVLAQDKQYAEWLTAQPWFRDKFAGLYTVIINKFQEPSETPEHAE